MANRAFYILVAMWLWCVAAAGETIHITPDMLAQQDGSVIVSPPCNWDNNLVSVTVTGVYSSSTSDVVKTPIEPTSKSRIGSQVRLAFPPTTSVHETMPLHHLEVEMATTDAVCKQDFGFKQGNFVR